MCTSQYLRRRAWLFALCLLSLLLVACGGASGSSGSNTFNSFSNGQPGSAGQNNGTRPSLFAEPMPPTQTDCPSPALTGRMPILRSMTLGKDATVAYINDQGTESGANSFGELKLYDTVTGAPRTNSKVIFGKSVLVHIPNAIITEAQVSANGEWLLFVTRTPNASEIQMVRMDGKGLQTLYCAPPGTVQGLQWSPDATRFLFSQQAVSGLLNLYLFDMATGVVQPELVQQNSALMGYEARTWFDNNRAYVVGIPNIYPSAPAPAHGLFVFDTTKGSNQKPSDLVPIMKSSQSLACRSFDSDYNATVLVTSQCSQTYPSGSNQMGVLAGPSSVVAQNVTGGASHLLYKSQQQAVTQVRMLGHTSNTLLLTVNNLDSTRSALANGTSAPNGLWRMNLDGSGLTNLMQSDTFSECEFNQFTQYPWSNISLDNRLYALETQQVLGKAASTSLLVGSLNGGAGSVVTFENGSATQGLLAIVGWTSM